MNQESDRKFSVIVIVVIALLLGSALYRYETRTPANLALTSTTFYRPVMARMYSFNEWALPAAETPTTVGNAIAKVDPSFISGLIRLEAGAAVSSQMLADYNTVRGIILAANPNAKFDIWFRADKLGYNATLMIAAMQGVINLGMKVDAFSFDGLGGMSATGLQRVIQFAHSNGKLIGGDCTAACVGVDYIMVTDPLPNGFSASSNFSSVFVNGTTLSALSKLGIPIMLHLNNGAAPVDSTGNTFHSDWVNVFTDAQRENYIFSLAGQQRGNYYSFMYPVFWPVGTVGPPSSYWDSPNDGSLLQFMANNAATYNAYP